MKNISTKSEAKEHIVKIDNLIFKSILSSIEKSENQLSLRVPLSVINSYNGSHVKVFHFLKISIKTGIVSSNIKRKFPMFITTGFSEQMLSTANIDPYPHPPAYDELNFSKDELETGSKASKFLSPSCEIEKEFDAITPFEPSHGCASIQEVMTDIVGSSNAILVLRQKLVEAQWKAFISQINPDDYAQLVRSVPSEYEQLDFSVLTQT